MSYTKIVNIDNWLSECKVKLVATPANKRPKNVERPIVSRTWNERRAMARAVKKAWDDAVDSGMFVRTENGYKLC